MLFNSLQFFLFFIAVTSLYFALPHKSRWVLLLLASCWFYMAFVPIYLLILLFTIVIDYFAGILIEKSEKGRRKFLLIISLLANIGILCFFKYYNFFIDNINSVLGYFDKSPGLSLLGITLPIGLSFHTFQAMSYTIEVYRGNQKAEKHFGIYALYVMFYPQLVAGPIERPQNILHQLKEKHQWDYENFKSGLMLMAWGLFKKIVVADRLALIVNEVYGAPKDQTSANVFIAAVFFSFQIYCDFSGYSDIALGTARIMGFKLMENFRTPYFSKSISEFWSRWHISLSSWFRDYLYIPMGGSRVPVPRMYFNLFFVFVISGLWHGASWGFVIWGALNGLLLIFASIRNQVFPNLPKLPALAQGLVVFLLITITWIFFRAGTYTASLLIIEKLLEGTWRLSSINPYETLFCIGLIFFLCIKEKYFTRPIVNFYYIKLLLIVISIYWLGIFTNNQFIYFQF